MQFNHQNKKNLQIQIKKKQRTKNKNQEKIKAIDVKIMMQIHKITTI